MKVDSSLGTNSLLDLDMNLDTKKDNSSFHEECNETACHHCTVSTVSFFTDFIE